MQTNLKQWGLAAIVLIVVLGGGLVLLADLLTKQQTPQPNESLSAELQQSTWYLERIGGAVVDSAAYIRFMNDNQVGGFDGCNSFSAPYTLSDSTLTVTEPVTSTLVLCEDLQNQDAEFIGALLSSTTINLQGDMLFITTGTLGELGFTSKRIVAGLVGEWNYTNTVLNGETLPVVAGTRVTLEFDEEGTFNGEACNFFSGNYTAEDSVQGTLTMGDIIQTDRACLDVAVQRQETELFNHFNTAERFQIFDNNTLYIYISTDDYLTFTRSQ